MKPEDIILALSSSETLKGVKYEWTATLFKKGHFTAETFEKPTHSHKGIINIS